MIDKPKPGESAEDREVIRDMKTAGQRDVRAQAKQVADEETALRADIDRQSAADDLYKAMEPAPPDQPSWWQRIKRWFSWQEH